MRIQRFQFSSFDQPADSGPDKAAAEQEVEATAEIVPEAPRITEAELMAAKSDGYGEGFRAGTEAGQLQAQNDLFLIQQQLAQMEPQIVQRLMDIHDDYRVYLQTQSEEVTKLATFAVRKIAGQALKDDPLMEIEPMIRSCLLSLINEPKVTITVNAALAESLETRLRATLATTNEFEGEVNITGDPEMPADNCRIEWKNGSAERNMELIWEKLETIIQQYRPMSATPFRQTDNSQSRDERNVTALRSNNT